MKYLFVILFFIGCLQGFAQNTLKSDIKKESILQNSKQLIENKQPTFMVNGIIKDLNDTVKITLELIQNIEIVKTDPNYPNGLVKITMKKE